MEDLTNAFRIVDPEYGGVFKDNMNAMHTGIEGQWYSLGYIPKHTTS